MAKSGYAAYWSKHTHPKGALSGFGKYWAKRRAAGIKSGFGTHKHHKATAHKVTRYHMKRHRVNVKPQVVHINNPHPFHRSHPTKSRSIRPHSHVSKVKLYKEYVF